MDMNSETYSESSHSTIGSYIAIQLKLVAIAYYIAILYIKLYILFPSYVPSYNMQLLYNLQVALMKSANQRFGIL